MIQYGKDPAVTKTHRPASDDVRGEAKTSDAPVKTPGAVRWRRLSEWPVTSKVVAVLAIPALIATLFGAVQVASQAASASRDAAAVTQTAALTRAWAVLRAADDVALRTGPEAATNLKEAANDLRAARDASALNEAQRGDVDRILAAARTIAASPGAGAKEPSTELGRAVADLADGIETTDATVSARAGDVRELAVARVELGKQRSDTAFPTLVVGVMPVVLATGIGAEAVALSRITVQGGAGEVVASLLDRNRGRLAQVQASGLPAAEALTATAERYDAAAKQTIASLTDAANASSRAAWIGVFIVSALILILLLLGVAGALLIARSLSRPLQAVRSGALQIADERLPQDVDDLLSGAELRESPVIPVQSDEEIGQLARAVESMYGRARELATAQAALRQQVSGMFETLSRRSNALLDRQLSIVERLEHDEPDPRRLAELFELDHLAARMRRNGESLLVLAGAQSRSTRGGTLTVADAVQAASSEVAQYQRVVVGELGGQAVTGAFGSDLVHLLAELLDNALSYSSPRSEVHVVGARTADGGLLLEIVDNGLGIETAERDELNGVLRSTAALTPDAARRMGLYVVGRLAAQHDVTVTLRANPRGGTIAAVALPADVLAAVPGTEPVRTEPPTRALPVVDGTEPPPRLAPVADLTERAAQRTAPEQDSRPALARRVRARSDADAKPALPARRAERADPGEGRFVDTADPRTIRTWVTSRSAEPGDEDVTDDRAPDVTAVAVTAHTSGSFEDVPDTSPVTVVGDGEPIPVYSTTRSRWLTDTGSVVLPWTDDDEASHGRIAAARAARPVVGARTASGLPRREPGANFVPGGVAAGDHGGRRLDPQAVRESVNRHLSGVRRGRAAARRLAADSDGTPND